MLSVKRGIKWKQDYNVRRGPKTEENEDYAEDEEDEEENKIEHENVYYGEVSSLRIRIIILSIQCILYILHLCIHRALTRRVPARSKITIQTMTLPKHFPNVHGCSFYECL